MKNVQIIDGAKNATFSLFQAANEELGAIFPGDRDLEVVEDLIERLGEQEASQVLAPLGDRPVLKRDAGGLHGTLFYDGMGSRIPAANGRLIGMMVRSIRRNANSFQAVGANHRPPPKKNRPLTSPEPMATFGFMVERTYRLNLDAWLPSR